MPDTLRWLCEAYYQSDAFMSLDERTRYVRKQVVEHCLNEPTEPGAKTLYADFPLDRMTPKAIKVLRDRKARLPEAANVRVKAFRQIFAWAMEAETTEKLTANHARDVAYKPRQGDGFHAWTLDEVERFEEHYPVGTTARLAMALLLYTGQRRSDIVVLGRQHVRDGWLIFTQFKGRNRKPARMEIPIIPELQRIIDASPTGDLTYLKTTFGKPFTGNGFGNRMRKWCNDAGLSDCSSHGLRKAAAARLAELGCSDREIMSITGHTTTKEIDRYTRSARQRKMAENVLRRINDAS
ncbi:tyrosine-type recombinase/integrase [Kaistia soli]|nr:tyrosine-type recombinase/integrase [Kaistia soli]